VRLLEAGDGPAAGRGIDAVSTGSPVGFPMNRTLPVSEWTMTEAADR
jgi:hypothetical protein